MFSFWFKKYASSALPAFFVCSFIFLSGCAAQERWYKPDHFQVDFDQDSLECEGLSHEMARQATMTGKGEDLTTFITSYNNCLYRKGWSNTPSTPLTLPETEKGATLAVLEEGKVHGLGVSLQVPQGFTLLSASSQVSDPVASQSFLWEGDNSTFINIVYQKATAKSFDAIDYLVVEPFFLYERGRDEKMPDFLRWAVFAGEVKKSWVVGLGGYVLANKHERILVVVTRSLPSPETSPPPGMRLSKGQRDAADGFMKQWRGWLAATLSR